MGLLIPFSHANLNQAGLLHWRPCYKVHVLKWVTNGTFSIQMLSVFRPSPRLLKTGKPAPSAHIPFSCCHVFQGTVISPSMDPSMSLQPASMMAPLAQQMSHLSLGSAGTVRRPLLAPKRYACFRLTNLKGDSASLHSMCSLWQPAHLCKAHISPSMHTYSHQLFLSR